MSNRKVLAYITAFFYFLSASGKVCERLCELRSLPGILATLGIHSATLVSQSLAENTSTAFCSSNGLL